jgi:hypothetical protein
MTTLVAVSLAFAAGLYAGRRWGLSLAIDSVKRLVARGELRCGRPGPHHEDGASRDEGETKR